MVGLRMTMTFTTIRAPCIAASLVFGVEQRFDQGGEPEYLNLLGALIPIVATRAMAARESRISCLSGSGLKSAFDVY
jgi:hypothetical protein